MVYEVEIFRSRVEERKVLPIDIFDALKLLWGRDVFVGRMFTIKI